MRHLSVALIRQFLRVYRLQTLPIAEWYFRDSTPGTRIASSLFGYALSLDVCRSSVHRMLCLQLEQFIAERHLILELIKPGDCVIDVGANIGYYLLMLRRKVGDTGRVVCIEPEPNNLRELHHCIESNRFNNVEIIKAAVGEGNGTVLLQPGLNGRVSPGESDEGSGINVPVIALDQLASRRPALIKIDIEGFEGQALRGMKQLLSTQSPTLFVEIHPHLMTYGASVREVLQMVQPYYRESRFWEAVHGGSRVQRLVMRYIPARAIRELRTAERLIRECEQGSRKTTFWMICKN